MFHHSITSRSTSMYQIRSRVIATCLWTSGVPRVPTTDGDMIYVIQRPAALFDSFKAGPQRFLREAATRIANFVTLPLQATLCEGFRRALNQQSFIRAVSDTGACLIGDAWSHKDLTAQGIKPFLMPICWQSSLLHVRTWTPASSRSSSSSGLSAPHYMREKSSEHIGLLDSCLQPHRRSKSCRRSPEIPNRVRNFSGSKPRAITRRTSSKT